MHRRARTLGIALALAATPGVVAAAPTRVVPEKKNGKERRAERRTRDYSQGGTRNGALELTLGAVTAGVTVLLIGRGGWELTHGSPKCSVDSPTPCTGFDPPHGNQIAAGLAFGFAVPIAIASGFLFARGARTLRQYRTWHREHDAALTTWLDGRGGGLRFRFRF